MKKTGGFTLVEIMITTALITVVSALGLVAMQSSSRAIELNQALSVIQQDARAAMMLIGREVEFAVKQAPTGFSLPLGAEGAIVENDGNSFTYQIPTNEDFTTFSPPITLTFDEDTRQILRIQSGETQVIGSANSVTQAQFQLRDQNSILRVILRTEEPIRSLEDRTAQFNLQSDIYLMN